MNFALYDSNETHTLATRLADRYGPLALTRAAGEAASAKRKGDTHNSALWYGVIAYIRSTMTASQATA